MPVPGRFHEVEGFPASGTIRRSTTMVTCEFRTNGRSLLRDVLASRQTRGHLRRVAFWPATWVSDRMDDSIVCHCGSDAQNESVRWPSAVIPGRRTARNLAIVVVGQPTVRSTPRNPAVVRLAVTITGSVQLPGNWLDYHCWL
jgi:hypothetical protein